MKLVSVVPADDGLYEVTSCPAQFDGMCCQLQVGHTGKHENIYRAARGVEWADGDTELTFR